jgi:trans-aconitate methyltransferase
LDVVVVFSGTALEHHASLGCGDGNACSALRFRYGDFDNKALDGHEPDTSWPNNHAIRMRSFLTSAV